MKKLKNYILMLLVPLILLGCVSKGVSDAVEETTDSNVRINETLANLINTNISVLSSYYSSTTFATKSLLYNTTGNSIINYLKEIKSAYLNGNITTSELDVLSNSLSEIKTDFFYNNGLLEYANMVSTYTNIQIKIADLKTNSTADLNDINDLETIQDKFLEYIEQLKLNYATNANYVELDESSLLSSWLNTKKTISNTSLSYLGLLEKYYVIDDSDMTDKYNSYVSLINKQLNILNNVDTILSVDSLINETDYITNKFYTSNILTTTQKTELKTQLVNLKSMYSNYKDNLSNISTAEYNFYYLEKEYLIQIAASNSYYYRIKISGTSLNIQFIDNTNISVTTDISTELKRIYKIDTAISGLSLTQKLKVKIIYENIDNMLNSLTEYNSLNTNTIYSACITVAQLLQMLKDNKLFIDTIVD